MSEGGSSSDWEQKYTQLKQDYDAKCAEYDELKIYNDEYEQQTEQLLEDAQEEADRANKELLNCQQENDKLNRYYQEYLKIKEKYHEEVREVEMQNESQKSEMRELKERLVELEMDNEDLERRNQVFENAVEDLEEKLESVLEEIAITQTDRDDTKSLLTEQIEKLNQQIEELQMDIEVKDKQIKKYKFLQILHDYPTTANEILDRAVHPVKTPSRKTIAMPNSARHKSSSEFNFRKQNTGKVDHRNSDFMYGPSKPSITSFMAYQGAEIGQTPSKSSEIAEIIGANERARRNSTDFQSLSSAQRKHTLMGSVSDSKAKAGPGRKSSADLLTSPAKTDHNQTTDSAPAPCTDGMESTVVEKSELAHQNSIPFKPAAQESSNVQSKEQSETKTPEVVENSEKPDAADETQKFTSFGEKKTKDSLDDIDIPKETKNDIMADIDAILASETADLDLFDMDTPASISGYVKYNSSALRIIQGLEDMIDNRINVLCEKVYC